MDIIKQDLQRYSSGKMPFFQKCLRKVQLRKGKAGGGIVWKVLYVLSSRRNLIEIPTGTKIGGGLYIGHPYCITVNQDAVIGYNCNIHKGVTIGQENRGSRKGVPTIGNNVWIGINSAIVGKITIGDDVLIAPNSYVNCDVPSHSVVIGNPCVIHHRDNATENYINRAVDINEGENN